MGIQPQALRDRPELDKPEKFYFDIFNKVSKYRQFTMAGPLAIPVEAALLSYCDFYGIHDVEQREQIAKAVEILDSEYLAEMFKKKDEKPSE